MLARGVVLVGSFWDFFWIWMAALAFVLLLKYLLMGDIPNKYWWKRK